MLLEVECLTRKLQNSLPLRGGKLSFGRLGNEREKERECSSHHPIPFPQPADGSYSSEYLLAKSALA